MTVLPELSFQEISQYFHLPISQAAKELKVCETLLKKICRVNGIKRWPHRKIRSIDTMINLLEFRLQTEKLSEKEKTRMRNEILDLEEKKNFFMTSPNTTYQSIIPKNTLQSFSKTKLKNQKSFSLFLHSEAKKPHSSVISTTTSTLRPSSEPSTKFSSFILSNMKFHNEEYNSDIVNNVDNLVKNKRKKNNVNNNHLEEEEEEVLNLLYSLKNQSQTTSNDNIDNNNDQSISNENNNLNINDNLNNDNNSNDNNEQQNCPNELYKLSLLAILNPIHDDENEFDNNKVTETKRRNILRRSMDNFDQINENNTKKRKLDSFDCTSSTVYCL